VALARKSNRYDNRHTKYLPLEALVVGVAKDAPDRALALNFNSVVRRDDSLVGQDARVEAEFDHLGSQGLGWPHRH
jgi:hypothetical protein